MNGGTKENMGDSAISGEDKPFSRTAEGSDSAMWYPSQQHGAAVAAASDEVGGEALSAVMALHERWYNIS